MKRNLIVLGLSVLLLCGITACDSGKKDAENQGTETDTQKSFDVAGIDNKEDVAAFLAKLQKAVAADDKNAVAGMVTYPFSIYEGGKVKKTYRNATVFIADYEALFPLRVKEKIMTARTDTLFANYNGVMIGNGEVWIGLKDKDIKIIGINPAQ